MTIQVTLTKAQVVSIASLHACTAQGKSEREKTSQLACINVSIENGRLTARATDRYIVGEVSFSHKHNASDRVEFSLNSGDWSDISKRVQTQAFLDIEEENANWSERIVKLSMGGPRQVGSYLTLDQRFPAVGKFFPETMGDLPSGLVHNMTLLARIDKMVTPSMAERLTTSKRKGLGFAMSAGDMGLKTPTVFTRLLSDETETCRAVIQPMLQLHKY